MEVHRSRRRASQSGFTLVELMIVVALIMVVAALVAPSLSAIQGDSRQQSAAVDLVRLSRRARAITMRSRTVHLLRFRQDQANGHGMIEIYAGLNNRCLLTDWNTEAFTNHNPVETFDMIDFNPGKHPNTNSVTDMNRQVITLRVEYPQGTAHNELHICYQPDGQTYAGLDPNLVPQAGSILFRIARTVPGIGGARGVPREVLFPAGGTARIR